MKMKRRFGDRLYHYQFGYAVFSGGGEKERAKAHKLAASIRGRGVRTRITLERMGGTKMYVVWSWAPGPNPGRDQVY